MTPSLPFFALVLLRLCSGFSTSPIQHVKPRSLIARSAATGIQLDAPLTFAEEKDAPKVGVLMLNLGGPETGEDVEGELSF